MGDVELVIFDCDGVLVDSERISNDVLARLLSEEGLPTSLEQARAEYQGLLMREVIARAQECLGRALAPDWLARFEQRRAEVFARDLKPVSGAAEVLRCVRAAGVPCCVASQAKIEKTHMTLGLTGLRSLVSDNEIFSAEQVKRGKPYPDLFLHAARVMGADPSHCTVVEDTPSGVRAAVAAGMHALGYAADSDEAALSQAGAQTFLSLWALPGLLGLAGLRG